MENYARLLVAASASSTTPNAPDDQENPQEQLPPILPDVLVQALAWILGEYGYLSENVAQGSLIHHLATGMAHRPFADPATRGYVVGGVVKLVAQTGACLCACVWMYAWAGRWYLYGWTHIPPPFTHPSPTPLPIPNYPPFTRPSPYLTPHTHTYTPLYLSHPHPPQGTCPPEAAALLRLYGESQDLDLQQRCHEYATLLQNPGVMVAVLPVDARYVYVCFLGGYIGWVQAPPLDPSHTHPSLPPTKHNEQKQLRGPGRGRVPLLP